MDLPAGLTHRPLRLADAPSVVAVMAAQELLDVGQVLIEEADIVGDWTRPSFEVAASTRGVFDGHRLVGYAEVGPDGRGDAAVHPDQRGRGIGTALARWLADHARERGLDEVGMAVPQGSPGDRLLQSLGWRVRWESWALALPEGAAVPSRPLPPGYTVRTADPSEYEQCWEVQEEAFLEWSVRERASFEDWRAQVTERPGFEPWNLRVVVDPAGQVVAMAWVTLGEESAVVARLATRRQDRGRGMAQALLVDSFAEGRARGTARFELSTDSRTGALPLYERLGMVVTSTWVNRAIRVGPPAPGRGMA